MSYEPVDVIFAPFIQSARLLYLIHVNMSASEYYTDGLYLVLAYLTSEACRIKAVLDGCCAVTYTIGELDEFTVLVCPCRVGILWLYGSLDVGRHAAVRSLCFL